MLQPRTIVVIDRHALYREALAALLGEAWPDAEIVALDRPTASAVSSADVLLVDLDTLPQPQAADLAAFVRSCGAGRVIALADAALDQQVARALHAGVCAFVPKTMSRAAIRDAVALALQGVACFPADALRACAGSTLLRCGREVDVLRQLDRGCSNKVIARELGVSVATVKAHVQSILRATQARNRTEAVANARRMGMLPAH